MGDCDYFEKNECTSCSHIGLGIDQQLLDKTKKIKEMLSLPNFFIESGPEFSFRTRAKMAVGPWGNQIGFGYWSKDQKFHAITSCPIHVELIRLILEKAAELIQNYKIKIYEVPTKDGDLKYLLLSTNKAQNEIQLRWVVRQMAVQGKIKKVSDELCVFFPQIKSIWLNLHPDHVASFEGKENISLMGSEYTSENYNGLDVFYGPQSFFQTNPYVAEKLYARAEAWLNEWPKTTVLDLYCGVGGFALHAAKSGHQVTGVEISAEAIKYAQMGAKKNNLSIRFLAGDSLNFLHQLAETFNIFIVNPPRRGLGDEVVELIKKFHPQKIIYSSCNPETFLIDSTKLESDYVREEVIGFDMFPHTEHLEILSLWRLKNGR